MKEKHYRWDHSTSKHLDDPREDQRDACGVGFIANMTGKKSHKTLQDGLHILCNMDHRGGVAADNQTSDGSGILIQIPHKILKAEAEGMGRSLPETGNYALAMMFLPAEAEEVLYWKTFIADLCSRFHLEVLFFRDVPIASETLGPIAKATEPEVTQCVLLNRPEAEPSNRLEWRLYLLRKHMEAEGVLRYGIKQRRFYVASLSLDSVCYKGLVQAKDLANYFLDLKDARFETAFAMVHQRFSTNTLPSWPLAQPFRMISHNGEINTLRGNINAMHARSFLFKDENLVEDFQSLGPVCVPGMSDSSMLDNAAEFLVATGRPLAQVLSMLIPEPWERNSEMNSDLKDYYEYHSYIMEPWDGPAFVGFCHGQEIGAILDRNGLRPGRYWITRDGFVVMASEVGVLPRKPEEILERGRLRPGSMFLLNMKSGTIVPDATIKKELSSYRPYGAWLEEKRIHLEDLPLAKRQMIEKDSDPTTQQKLVSFGYSKEDLRLVLAPMANQGKEPMGSMGNDTPLAILSQKRPLLYNYFKQLFAQVTNPPIDALREKLVTSLSVHLGAESNLLESTPKHCAVLKMSHPILTSLDLSRIEQADLPYLRSVRIPTTYLIGSQSLELALDTLAENVIRAVERGFAIIILSDLEVGPSRAAIPALLAVSSVHHALMRSGHRSKCSLIVESGEPREVHHFALLIGFGAAAIQPYLALEIVAQGEKIFGFDADISPEKRQSNFIKSICDGILKTMSKMGISVLHSYRGAQIFECLGLSQNLINRYFSSTPGRLEGLDLKDIEEDIRALHGKAYLEPVSDSSLSKSLGLSDNGIYAWRKGGESHLHRPEIITSLQKSVRRNSRDDFKAFCETIDRGSSGPLTLRNLFSFRKNRASIPLTEVEDIKSIVKRMATGAMSFGSISKETHETIAIAMNRIGARSNSGEGGEDFKRYTPDSNGDSRRSAIKQIASARFGVTSHYLTQADELQIKISQGAKPGEGGQLPGFKVDEEIARVRHSTPGVTLISPPPHHDIYSIEDLAQLIYDLKNANSKARISVKLVAESGVGTIAAGVAKAGADVILISGHEGGTGASPLSSVHHAGVPWELGLSETHRVLVENHLRGRVVLQTDGLLRTPRDIVIAALLGAEEWGIGTGALLTLGCVMMRKCHLNTCPVGIATQDPELRKKFQGQPEHLINYIFLVAEGVREIMAELGFSTIEDMIGRVDLLEKDPSITDPRLKKTDLSSILAPAKVSNMSFEERNTYNDFALERCLDAVTLIPACRDALETRRSVELSQSLTSFDRSTGTMLSAAISQKWGHGGLPDATIKLQFDGAAGQSFMAFGAHGITAILWGEVNDYCAKGLSGATVIVKPERGSLGHAEDQVICGNTALYGATSGHLYLRGKAGERFAVRNSGAHAVVEGVGDHGCEYMTGGTVVVLGEIGRNFAAGMSGGYAFVYDEKKVSDRAINRELVHIEKSLEEKDALYLKKQLQKHFSYTSSTVAARILNNWEREREYFVLVIPIEYRDLMDRREALRHPKPLTKTLDIDYMGGGIRE